MFNYSKKKEMYIYYKKKIQTLRSQLMPVGISLTSERLLSNPGIWS